MPTIDPLDNLPGGSSGGGNSESGQGSEGVFNSDGSTPQGNAPSNYDYDIVSDGTVIGKSYYATNTSTMTCNQSVAVMSKVYGFAASDNSSAILNSCVSYAGNFGFSCVGGSSGRLANCISSKHKFNYYCTLSSAISAHYCCGIFPLDYNVYCNSTSSFNPIEFESMTKVNARSTASTVSDFVSNQPVHFGSFGNCIVHNSSDGFATRTSLAGFSGGVIAANNIRFFWSEISPVISTFTNNTANSIGASTVASYRYVPIQHSVDYNVNDSSNNSFEEIRTSTGFGGIPALMAVIAYRTNYVSVKPPKGIFPPEDKSGSRDQTTVLTGAYNISELSRQGFNI